VRGVRRPSENCVKLAQKLRDGFERDGFGKLLISPTEFFFVSGFWKKMDVYRWEVWCELIRPDSCLVRIHIGSMYCVKDCVKKHGVDIRPINPDYRDGICISNDFDAHMRSVKSNGEPK